MSIIRITILEPEPGGEEEIVIRSHELSPTALQLIAELKTPKTLVAYQGQEIHRLPPQDICYCETVDNRTFLYTAQAVYESRQRLYELEGDLGPAFVRVSKSVVLNILCVKLVRPAINGRFEAVLDNGETLVISRQYVPDVKQQLGL